MPLTQSFYDGFVMQEWHTIVSSCEVVPEYVKLTRVRQGVTMLIDELLMASLRLLDEYERVYEPLDSQRAQDLRRVIDSINKF